ncbi:MAG: PASTA domain-containing protein [Gemmatimonadetes bacterium]|nr:PASTA domain-containing protein [Gemmatimonadota bacterium]
MHAGGGGERGRDPGIPRTSPGLCTGGRDGDTSSVPRHNEHGRGVRRPTQESEVRLGGSLRRNRASGQASSPKVGTPDWKARGRVLLLAGTLVVTGSSVGYLYATQIAFPLPEHHTEDYREVPDLRGRTLAEAETLLTEMGLQVGAVDSIRHPERPEGSVVGQSPFPGHLAVPAGSVELTLSSGPERRSVPDVTSMRADRAMAVLQASGFDVNVDSVEAEIPPGRVIATSPSVGEELSLPARVRLTVSLGLPTFPMPGLVGLEEEEARALLDSLGLVVGEVGRRLTFNRGGEVIEQLPLPDSLVTPGAQVQIVIGRGL